MEIFRKAALCIFISTSLVACGGGGGDGDSSSNTHTNTNTTIPPASLTDAASLAKATAAIMVGLAVNEELY